MKKPQVESPDVRSRSETLKVFGFDPEKAPGRYWFTLFDPDLHRLRTFFEAVHAEGFIFDGLEPASFTWQKLYGDGCWSLKIGLTGIYPPRVLKSLAKDLCQRVTSGQVWAIFPVVGTSSIPPAPSKPLSWQKVWERTAKMEEVRLKAHHTEQAKAELGHLAPYFRGGLRSKAILSSWLKLTTIKVTGRGLVLVDMRPSPSEDEFEVPLMTGIYRLELRVLQTRKRIATIRAVTQSCLHPERGEILGTVSTDMGTLGVFDRASMKGILKKGGDAFRAWCEQVKQGQPEEYGVLVHDFQKRALLAYVQTGDGDGIFPVFELTNRKKRIGFEVEFIPGTVD